MDYSENDNINKGYIASEPGMARFEFKPFQIFNENENVIILQKVLNAPESSILLQEVLNKTELPQKFLAEIIFEINTKTFMSYSKTDKKIPFKLKEVAIQLLVIYDLGIEIFGDAKIFNKWLKMESYGLNKLIPINILNTSAGFSIVFEELKRIEFGATA